MHAAPPDAAPATERVLGVVDGGAPGPIVIVSGGMHGNEPAGVAAIRRVLADLAGRRERVKGRVVGVACNLKALRSRVRYVHRDMNRLWQPADVDRLRAADPALDDPEQTEQRALLAVLDPLLAEARATGRALHWIDLHSTSSHGPPFVITGDTVRNRRLARALPVPLILGLEEIISGTIGEFVTEMGYGAIAIEGGQHDAPRTQDHHEAALWILLQATGVVEPGDVPRLAEHGRLLKDAARGREGVIDVHVRHGITAASGFAMKPGFRNFQPVKRGEELATDRAGRVLAPSDAVLLMPLYQGQGDDGFFLGRAVRRSWLRVSTGVRALRLDALLPLLPGVRRDPANPNALRIRRIGPNGTPPALFKLFGYRRVLRDGADLLLVRHPQ